MKMILFAAVWIMAGLTGCDQHKTVNETNNSVPAPQATIAADSLPGTVSITAFELKDDSVFTDGSIPTSWENAGFTDVKGFKLFLKQLQLWVMDNDKEKIATVIRYPLKDIRSPEDFIRSYDAVFTKDVKLSFATIHFSQVFRNDKGAMTEGGKVWFAQQGKDFKIIAVNN
jgi:hypothetical protein